MKNSPKDTTKGAASIVYPPELKPGELPSSWYNNYNFIVYKYSPNFLHL